jgi:SAM-dependent methyltransferase
MPTRGRAANWSRWLDAWDRQQESFNPIREARFTAMMDVLEAELGRRFTVLDLGSGPGSFSARILRRFPAARSVAVDYDPVVRRIGQGALGTFGGRLTWVDAKLGAPGWTSVLPRKRFDAAVSTTALHWLQPEQLTRLYRDLGKLLPRGGLFLNGDHLAWDRSDRDLAGLGRSVVRLYLRQQRIHRRNEWADWRAWWVAARKFPALREEFVEHDRRNAGHPKERDIPLSGHVRRLRAAGFRTTAVVWQAFENRVLFAVR